MKEYHKIQTIWKRDTKGIIQENNYRKDVYAKGD